MNELALDKNNFYQMINEMYQNKKDYITLKEVCNKIGCCEKTLRKLMRENNLYDNCPDVFRQILKIIHVFDNINNESAYWLGYLMADGCFTNNSTRSGERLMLECKIEDREILEKFCDFIGIRQERITIGHHGKSVALSLADSNFFTSVSKYGIVHNKSHLEITIPKEISSNNDFFLQFLKGLIDGDGTIHTYVHSPGISFVTNSKTLAEESKNILSCLLPEPTSIWIMEKTKEFIPKATQSLFTLKIGSGRYNRSNLRYIFDAFYKNKKIILTRKYELLKSLINN